MSQKTILALLIAVLTTAIVSVGATAFYFSSLYEDKESDEQTSDNNDDSDDNDSSDNNGDSDSSDDQDDQNEADQAPDGWTLYESEELGFSVYYPSDWEVTENENSVGFGTKEVDEDFMYGERYHSFGVAFEPDLWFLDSEFADMYSEVSVSGMDGYLVDEAMAPGACNPSYYLEVGNDEYVNINYCFLDEVNSDTNSEDFMEIFLESFTLLD